jgi:hypothetical protein
MTTVQYDLFAGTPPHVRHSSTSLEAADAIRPSIGKLHRVVLNAVAAAPDGLTREEIEQVTGLSHQTGSARVRELFLQGRLETRIDPATGRSFRRPTSTGRSAEVCFIAS